VVECGKSECKDGGIKRLKTVKSLEMPFLSFIFREIFNSLFLAYGSAYFCKMAVFKLSRKFGMMTVAIVAASAAYGQKVVKGYPIAERLNGYKKVALKTDTTVLTAAEKKCLVYLIKAAKKADDIFWKQTFTDKETALKGIKNDTIRRFMEINYGPWDRLNDEKPFLQGYGEKPKGANFYPPNFDANQLDEQMKLRVFSPYAIVKDAPKMEKPQAPAPPKPGQPAEMPMMMERMPLKNGKEIGVVEYGFAYQKDLVDLMEHMNKAAEAIEPEDKQFARYLKERATALMSGEYIMTDIRWLTLKSHLDIVIGPIENYEDKLFGVKTSYEAYVLVRDMEWGKKLEKFIALLPELQANIPVEAAYKPVLANDTGVNKFDDHGNLMSQTGEMINEPGFPPMQKPDASLSQLAVFDAVYYAGDCNSGSKTIAVNLPNDEVLQKYFGTRRSQLKNTMRAKFDEMVKPISQILVDPSQLENIKFDAFFSNVMFHEVAHGLGVKNLVNEHNKTVREALGATYSAIEECKADVLGLYMVTQLFNKGELSGKLDDYYVTFVASVFRSVRFGAASAHGKANMITFNTLLNSGCITPSKKGYFVNVVAMKAVIEKLAAELLHLQGDGNVKGVQAMLAERGVIKPGLAADLAKLEKAKIPFDLVFDQGIETLGLQHYDEASKTDDKSGKKQEKSDKKSK
jgi:hypothetical protein